MKGKTIRIYLVDGVATGVLTAEIINWTGRVLVAPRAQLADLARRDEVKRTGVYCLVGQDPQKPLLDKVYIGEGDNVLTRLTAHEKDESKDFWTRTLVVISKDENLTKSHGRYLESRLIGMAGLAGRASMVNGTAPPLPPLPEPDVADMEYFLEQMQMMLPVLGFTFLQPRPTIEIASAETTGTLHSPIFVMTDVGASASAKEVDGEFVVLQGCRWAKITYPIFSNEPDFRAENGHIAEKFGQVILAHRLRQLARREHPVGIRFRSTENYGTNSSRTESSYRAMRLSSMSSTIMSPFPPPHQNLWVNSGSGNAPSR